VGTFTGTLTIPLFFFAEWKGNKKAMVKRISEMEVELHRLLTEEYKTPGGENAY
jgi:hypothetical protein